MHLIQLLLPLHDNNKDDFPAAYFEKLRQDLTDRFGGVTAFVRTPAVGLWKEANDDVSRDEVILFEVMSPALDTLWWRDYRTELQEKFRQEEVLVWASTVTRL
ncbi:MAG TPA: hypothetical protein VK475_12480 [Pyrinomonadaceae bacterium]|nr:hypothetical protein [Pyrinomonadaceae bacterium]